MTKLNKELAAVQHCLKLALELEQQFSNSNELRKKLPELKKALSELAFIQNPKIQKLAEIEIHLHESMSAQHFSNFIIPLERFLDRSLRDDDFLVTTEDHKPLNPNVRPQRRLLVFILDNIRSAFNVGSMIRLADCVGASEVLLCGYTPGFDHNNNIHPTILKTSLGAAHYVKISSYQKIHEALQSLKKENYHIIALETSKNSKSIYEKPLLGPTAFLVGNERFGLDTQVLELADEVRHIPVYGIKNSLNVSNALTAAAFEWSRQNP